LYFIAIEIKPFLDVAQGVLIKVFEEELDKYKGYCIVLCGINSLRTLKFLLKS
jgi:hypothetical protein